VTKSVESLFEPSEAMWSRELRHPDSGLGSINRFSLNPLKLLERGTNPRFKIKGNRNNTDTNRHRHTP